MTLSLLLLGSSKSTHAEIDKGLDNLFKSSATASASALASPEPQSRALSELPLASSTKKRKKKEYPVITTETDSNDDGSGFGRSAKKAKLGSHGGNDVGSTPVTKLKPEKKKRTKDDKKPMSEVAKMKERSRGEKKRPAEPVVLVDENDEDAVEDGEQDPPPPGSEDDGKYVPPVHESLAGTSRSDSTSRKKSKKYIPPDETPDQRDSRTIFVGNVPSQVMATKPLLKRFKRHILSFVPTAKIESVRFRSIAFQKPTTKLPSEIDPSASSSEPPKRPAKDKEPLRQHEIDRVSAWQSSKDTPTGDPEKKYLTPQEKKRVAFIKHDFHENGDSVNAYVVFAHPPPKGMAERPEAVDIMDPYEAAKVAVVMCDGTPFEGKTLRVDGARKSRTGDAGREVMGDPKLSIFVGNLDFASKEEDLRAFFETLVANERGSQPQAQSLGGGDETKSSGWVTRVRIVRDKDTQLGKGFAYVQFVDRECVDEILALEQGNIKFAKRKLRVQRCKATTSSSTPTRGKTEKKAAAASTSSHNGKTVTVGTIVKPRSSGSTVIQIPTPGSIPKGDPNLGKQLEHLSKEERKKEKAANADRVARRLAKKQVGVAMAKGKLKFGGDGRERVRIRKKGGALGAPSSGKTRAKKTRVRGEANVAKRNIKK